MKKLLLTTVALGLLLSSYEVASAKAIVHYRPGTYYAKRNINVRSQPMVGDNRINHYNKGQTVKVTRADIYDWCKIAHPRYAKSYVYCPNLAPLSLSSTSAGSSSTNTNSTGSTGGINSNGTTSSSGTSTSSGLGILNHDIANPSNGSSNSTGSTATTNSNGTSSTSTNASNSSTNSSTPGVWNYNTSTKDKSEGLVLVDDMDTWINDYSNYGNSYVNDSFTRANTAATAWDKDAQLAQFNLQFNHINSPSCTFTYLGPNKKTKYNTFTAPCADPKAKVYKTTVGYNVNNLQGISSTAANVTLKDFVSAMKNTPAVRDQINKYFQGSTEMASNLWLKKNADGILTWKAELLDTSKVRKMTIQTPADQGTINLQVTTL